MKAMSQKNKTMQDTVQLDILFLLTEDENELSLLSDM